MKHSLMIGLLLACCLVAVPGCRRKENVDVKVNTPIYESSSDNPQVPVSHLVTIEDCKIYRFIDAAAYRYVAICPHAASVETIDEERCGKKCRKTTTDSTHTFY